MPYLYYPDAAAALQFLVEAFGFHEVESFRDDDGTVLHAQLSTGEAIVMIGPGMAEFGTRPVADPAWATSRTFVYVDDPDGHCEAALAAERDRNVEHGPGKHRPVRRHQPDPTGRLLGEEPSPIGEERDLDGGLERVGDDRDREIGARELRVPDRIRAAGEDGQDGDERREPRGR